MLGQAMQAQFAFAPFLALVLVGLAMFVAVTLVIIALAKSGKTAGVIAVFVFLMVGGLMFLGLATPLYLARQAKMSPLPPPVMVMPQELRQMRDWQVEPPHQETVQLLPLHPEPVAPAPPAQVVPPYEDRNPEVISEEEMNITAEAASPSDQSSASPDEAAGEEKSARRELASSAKPDWMKEAVLPTREFVERKVIHIERHATLEEIQAELPSQIEAAMHDFMRAYIAPNAPQLIKLPPGYAVDHGVLADRWTEIHPAEEHSFGEPMYSLHVLLQFDRNLRSDLELRYEQAKVGYRLGAFGLGGGLLLSLLATLYGYLKLDTVTKGYYTGRLRVAAGLTGISAATTAAALVAEGVVRWV